MKIRLIIIIALIGLFVSFFGQQSSAWDKWYWLTGKWIGEGIGQPGQGGSYFAFKTDFENNILVRKSYSVYASVGKRPYVIHIMNDDLIIVYPGNSGISFKTIYFVCKG
jgi:hypothetical protein